MSAISEVYAMYCSYIAAVLEGHYTADSPQQCESIFGRQVCFASSQQQEYCKSLPFHPVPSWPGHQWPAQTAAYQGQTICPSSTIIQCSWRKSGVWGCVCCRNCLYCHPATAWKICCDKAKSKGPKRAQKGRQIPQGFQYFFANFSSQTSLAVHGHALRRSVFEICQLC